PAACPAVPIPMPVASMAHRTDPKMPIWLPLSKSKSAILTSHRFVEADRDCRLALGTLRALELADEGRLPEPLIFAQRRLETGRRPHRLRRLAIVRHAQSAIVDD